MIQVLTIIFFALGLIIGSFLNVVIARYNTQKNFGGRSACMSCENKLCWYELIPLFSFFALRGRCRSCKTKISTQYPLVELGTGLLFALLFLKFQNVFFFSTIDFAISYALYATMFSLLVVIAVYDLKHKIIPDTLSLVFGVLAFLGLFLFTNFSFHPHIPGFLGISFRHTFCSAVCSNLAYIFRRVDGLGRRQARDRLGLVLGY